MLTQQLQQLGWNAFFQQQLSLEDYENLAPVRVVQQYREHLVVSGDGGEQDLPLHHSMPTITVGDWLLLDGKQGYVRLLERKSLFSRKAAGTRVQEQLIAANVDTAFLVCSLN